MRALLIVDRLFAQHERAMLGRTAIGLLDEGIETKLVVPDLGQVQTTNLATLVPQIKYKDRGFSFTLKIRAANILRELASEKSQDQWDIIHAFGGQSWALAHELARSLDAALVLELWRAGLITRASQFLKHSTVQCMCTAPDQSIVQAASGTHLPIQVAPWGVPAPPSPRSILDESNGISIVFHSSGRNKPECTAAFDGVLDAIEAHSNIHLFVNLHATQRAALWQRAQKANALNQLTLIDKIEEQRDLALNADFLIYPDTIHEHRSFLYEAMGNAICIIASTAEQSSSLIKDRTAAIVPRPNRTDWSNTLKDLIADPARARTLGNNAWTQIRDHRKVSAHIGATIDAYTQLIPAQT